MRVSASHHLWPHGDFSHHGPKSGDVLPPLVTGKPAVKTRASFFSCFSCPVSQPTPFQHHDKDSGGGQGACGAAKDATANTTLRVVSLTLRRLTAWEPPRIGHPTAVPVLRGALGGACGVYAGRPGHQGGADETTPPRALFTPTNSA